MIAIFSIVLSVPFFVIISELSPLIDLRIFSLIYASLFAVGIYTIMEITLLGKKGVILELFLLVIVMIFNIGLCDYLDDHYKACYGIKIFICLMAVMGLICQFIDMNGNNNEK